MKYILIIILSNFCTKNPIKSKKYYINTVFDVIKKEIYKQYIEKSKRIDKICSYEYLFLESKKCFNMEASEEIYKFIFAKKVKKFQVMISLVQSNEMYNGFVFNISISIFGKRFIGFGFNDSFYRVRYKNICRKSYSNFTNTEIKEYFIKKHILRFIFWYINIIKKIIQKMILDRNKMSILTIFSDIVYFEDCDRDFLSRLLIRQNYTSDNDCSLLINFIKINDKYEETKNNKTFLEYSFTNIIFESIKNISFERVEFSDQLLEDKQNVTVYNKIVAKEIIKCGENTYLNIYDIFFSSFKNGLKMQNREIENLDVFGYSSANIDAITFIKVNTPGKSIKTNKANKSNKIIKIKKDFKEICCLIIRNREFNLEYNIDISYKVCNNEITDIFVNQRIPGFYAHHTLKDKIACILRFVKEHEIYNFKLVYWDLSKSKKIYAAC
ncbi:hypothetical protein CWI38_0340p0030 [Hamiltosporidium tvaerminnensis]|uniref:Uncharacterized protein n=1 Tax=Hamiltosporidium tvaerminnensis TaxID=1176355 RepID=A0A4Q9LYD3_9MICR|nr:hypothetical protein CWI38_0340p0030 [Hamiltosporidium tvaerminnensis]